MHPLSLTQSCYYMYKYICSFVYKRFPSITFLYAGMLSKSKGQVLRVAAVLHVLFKDCGQEEEEADSYITTNAILAAQNFVDICCQHAAFITGRDRIEVEIKQFTSGKHFAG